MTQNQLCQFCGSFKPTIQGICESCDGEYAVIRSYIAENKNANLMQISSETNIPLKKIKLFVEKGNFILKM